MFARKTERKNPEIPTAALPDIIFILLFFFVITSQQKPVQELVDATIPTEERAQKSKAEHKIHITIGKPINSPNATEPVIQFENTVVSLSQINREVSDFRANKLDAASKGKTVVAEISADVQVSTGLIEDIQLELRNAGVYNIVNKTQN
jgi:biopolymer transport protein ExbD